MTEIRSTSDTPFPYGWPGQVCYFELRDGAVHWLKVRDEMRQAVTRALSGRCVIYAAWPGQWKTDLFVVDPAELAAAIKLGVQV